MINNENENKEKLDNFEKLIRIIDPDNKLFIKTENAIIKKRILMNKKEEKNESINKIDNNLNR